VPAILGFEAYLPSRVVTNAELARQLECEPAWILDVSGIEERRYASPEESVAAMGVAAAEKCIRQTGTQASDIGIVLVSSGSSERRFPGPASETAHRLGLEGVPAIDLPVASAGGLFAMALASSLAPTYGNVLVVASEKMSDIVAQTPLERGTAPLFGDGAGACLIGAKNGPVRILDSVLHTDGAFAADLRLDFNAPIAMNGRSVILQASRKIPSAIRDVLTRNGKLPSAVATFLMHQANQNLMDRVASALEVDSARFYSNIRRCGNTSSASMLIAAAEWWCGATHRPGDLICFAAFGAGFHWGAMLAEVLN
jgi:3-oxoacyl-[acyl-carrier-protein] synthase-3